MARWRQRVRLGLGIFTVGFAIVLWLVMGERQAPAPNQAIERIDPAAASEIRGGDAIQLKGATRDVRVEFASQVLYADGRTKYTGFKAFVDDRGGRSFVISGNEAWVGKDLTSYDVTGEVGLTTSDGLTVTTPRASFTEADGTLKGDGPVRFQRGRVTGSGVGFSYDRALDRLWLDSRAQFTVAPGQDSSGMQVRSGAAGHSRTERYLRFERGMRMERDGQIMEAETATVFLLEGRDEPEMIELRGNSRISGAAGLGSLQAMQAADINLRYAPDGRTLQQAVLARQASVQLARPDGSPGQQLAAELIDTSLAPDGAVTSLHARDQVRVTLPAAAGATPRTVTAPVLSAVGESGRGITTMTFQDGVEYREAAGKGVAGRVARARQLEAAMSPAGTIDEAAFTGDFRFEDGALAATSPAAVYQIGKGTLALSSAEGAPPPHIADERLTLDAQTIDVTLTPRRVKAAGKVGARFTPARRDGERGTTLLTAQEPVVVSADTFTFDETSATGVYSGKALLFQAKSGTQIRGDSISINEREGTLSARGNVVTTLPIAGRTAKGGPGTSLARAEEFQFDDAKRLAVFTTKAQLEGVQGNLRADRIEMRLAPADNTLERLDGHGAVTTLVDKRTATGQTLRYEPDEEQYVLEGTPVRLVQGCQESTGRTLTFYRASDRILVDGNEEIRVQTKGGECPDSGSR